MTHVETGNSFKQLRQSAFTRHPSAHQVYGPCWKRMAAMIGLVRHIALGIGRAQPLEARPS